MNRNFFGRGLVTISLKKEGLKRFRLSFERFTKLPRNDVCFEGSKDRAYALIIVLRSIV